MSVAVLFTILNVLGTFAFGLSGAMLAVRRQFDIFGILVLAIATGVAGGIIRDVLLGATPPQALQTFWPMAVASLGGLYAFFFKPQIEQFDRPVMVLDAPGAVLLGVMTAIGGGVLRDIMANEVPRVLHEDIYALAAFAGAIIYAASLWLGFSEPLAAGFGVFLAFGLRLASVRFGWKLPHPPTF